MKSEKIILGGGITGLATGWVSGLPVFEAAEAPGGICSSYYVRPGEDTRLLQAPKDGEVYRFEIGGGHWIFGGDPAVLQFIRTLASLKTYSRVSSVYFRKRDLYVPFPLQNSLRFLDSNIAARALAEMSRPAGPFRTMKEWLTQSFGPTLCESFFHPFHELYTAGLYDRIEPQDAYKSPVNLTQAIQGAFQQATAVGYNVTFVYPVEGLNVLAQRIAAQCDVRYGKRVTSIDSSRHEVRFADGSSLEYETLISTLPLNRMMELTGLAAECPPDPYTSVLVLNVGAVRGPKCPADHWLYNPDAESGFHRVGFYSNVDVSFLPKSAQQHNNRVSIYVERAYVGGTKVSQDEISNYAKAVVKELQQWDYIGEAEVVNPTWIDVAYTWASPGSRWKPKALQRLEEQNIYQVGRYGRWIFQGIADSIRDGFLVGGSFKHIQR